jgi:hypothetical protein
MTGCIVMTPPAFLSEEDAMRVIKEELGKHGIKLGGRGELRGVSMKAPLEGMKPRDARAAWYGPGDSTVHSFSVDGMDKKAGVAVEYVSNAECRRFDPWGRIGTVRSCKTKEVASCLAKVAAEQGPATVRIGVFYDPLVSEAESELYFDDEKLEKLYKTSTDAKASPEEREKAKKEIERHHEAKAKESMERLDKEAKGLLRKQVQDFVKWLDRQGGKKDG